MLAVANSSHDPYRHQPANFGWIETLAGQRVLCFFPRSVQRLAHQVERLGVVALTRKWHSDHLQEGEATSGERGGAPVSVVVTCTPHIDF